MRRLFVALELDEATRALAMEAAAVLRRGLSGRARLSFTRSEMQHVTLAFVGEVEASRLEDVQEAAAEVARSHAPIIVEAGGLGAFPRAECARVLWLAFGQQSSALRRLALDLQTRLRERGHDMDPREWNGHVTLARCRERTGVDARQALAGCPDRRVECRVEELVVMESRLAPNGRGYVPLSRVELRGVGD
jgi:RNA 2',3'-cyclic 3'-phosphodiesterase